MISVAENTALTSAAINWAAYFKYALENVLAGEKFDSDWCQGYVDGAVYITELNEKVVAPGTAEKVAEVEAAIKNGTLHVFDTATFTVNGETVTSCVAYDTDGDYVPDFGEAIVDGYFAESALRSAPYFGLDIDGIILPKEE